MNQAQDMPKQRSLFGIGTFQCSVLSNIPYISLPTAFEDELCPALAPVHVVLPKILFLGVLFLFPTKNEKGLTTVLLLIMYILNHLWGNILPFSML